MQYNEILKNLRECREPKTTQKDIADLLGTTQQYYSEYEIGNRKLPIEHLAKLCSFYWCIGRLYFRAAERFKISGKIGFAVKKKAFPLEGKVAP